MTITGIDPDIYIPMDGEEIIFLEKEGENTRQGIYDKERNIIKCIDREPFWVSWSEVDSWSSQKWINEESYDALKSSTRAANTERDILAKAYDELHYKYEALELEMIRYQALVRSKEDKE
jgi:hypothetical protein